MMNAIQILGPNRVKGAAVTVSSGALGAPNLTDQKPSTIWRSAGSDDSTGEWVCAQFLGKSGSPTACEFDRVLLLNTNMKSGYGLRHDGSAWAAISGAAVSGLDKPNKLLSFEPVSGFGLYFWLNTTQTPGEEKFLGELKACKHLLTLNALTELERSGEAKRGEYRLAGGELVKWAEWEKFGARLNIRNLAREQRDALRRAAAKYDFLTFLFNDEDSALEAYEVSVCAPISERLDRKTGLYELDLELKER